MERAVKGQLGPYFQRIQHIEHRRETFDSAEISRLENCPYLYRWLHVFCCHRNDMPDAVKMRKTDFGEVSFPVEIRPKTPENPSLYVKSAEEKTQKGYPRVVIVTNSKGEKKIISAASLRLYLASLLHRSVSSNQVLSGH
jgi:hypothetical protein